MSLLTIRGQLGSGAPEIGKQVARKLNIDYVDREVIGKVADRLKRDKQDVITKEMPPGTLKGRIVEALTSYPAIAEPYFGGAYLPPELIPLGDARYVAALESVVRQLAQGPSLVMHGRGSQFILNDHPASVHAFVVAPLEVRIKRVMQDRKVDDETAREEITRFDTSRHEFAKRYFHAELEDPIHYDLVINTGRLTFEAATLTVVNAFSSKTRIKPGKDRSGRKAIPLPEKM